MPFNTFIPLDHDNVHIRGYVHDAWGRTSGRGPEQAHAYLRGIMKRKFGQLTNYDVVLAALWSKQEGEEHAAIADLFGFSDMPKDRWPGNPDVHMWTMRDGVYLPPENVMMLGSGLEFKHDAPNRVLTCGDTGIMFGLEETLRRQCKGLDEYLRKPNVFGLPEYLP